MNSLEVIKFINSDSQTKFRKVQRSRRAEALHVGKIGVVLAKNTKKSKS